MKINKMVNVSVNLLRTHVTIQTPYGKYTEHIDDIRRKLCSDHLHPHVRRMFQEMLDGYNNEVQS